MFAVAPQAGVRFQLFDEVYTILKRLPSLKIEAECENFRTIKIFTFSELIKHLSNGNLHFESKGKNIKTQNPHSFCTSFFIENLENYPYKDRVRFMYEVISPILHVPINERSTAISNRVEEVNSWKSNHENAKKALNGCTYYRTISFSSVRRWVNYYIESNGDIRSLCPSFHNNGGKDKSRLPQQIQDFIQEMIEEFYNHQQRITVNELWFAIIDKISEFNKFSIIKLEHPSYSTIARYVRKIPEYELIAKRFSKKTADNKFNQLGDGIKVSFPLERVEVDQTSIDLMIVDQDGTCLGRPYLVLAICKFTRQVLGFSTGISNGVGWAEVGQCIKHIMTDKSYVKEIYPFIENEWNAFGVPKTIAIDNGPEFKNESMKDACMQLGIVLQYCRVGTPQWKGSIERYFRTCGSNLLHNLPGTTRSNPQELDDNENPSKLACITFSAFIAIIHKWIIDVYSQSLNKGAVGIPAKIWEKAIEEHPVSWPNSISETTLLLGRVAYRQISNQGIELLNLHYNSSEINMLLKQFSKDNNGLKEKFLVKYDPLNLGEVYLYDHIINKEWILAVPCTNREYALNLSEWEHKEICARARKETGMVDIESLARAKADIRKMVSNGMGYKKKEISRAKGITSDREISKKLQEKAFIQQVSPVVPMDTFNLSKIGITLQPPEIVVPQNVENSDKTEGKIIPINAEPKKKKQLNQEKRTPIINTQQAEGNSFDDLSGFRVFSIKGKSQ